MTSRFLTNYALISKPYGSKFATRTAEVDWNAYANAYDLMCEHNPSYQLILSDFEAFIKTIPSPQSIFDIGGGTGNFTEIAARTYPGSEVCLIDPAEVMMDVARTKLSAYENVTYKNLPLENVEAQGKADLVICVHALYAMPFQKQRINDLRRLLRPGGLLYLIDLGRYMNINDWRRYLFSHLRKKHGLAGALRILWQGRPVAIQNEAILLAQKRGEYWTHTGAEIASAVTAAGFEIISQKSAYRGYSDMLLCRSTPI